MSENCLNWSMLDGKVYKKCPQVYELEAIANGAIAESKQLCFLIDQLRAELAKNEFKPDYDATAGALSDAQEAIGELQAERAAQEALIAKHVVNGLTYAGRVHGLQDELASLRWIPVGERLPEEAGCYFAKFTVGKYGTAHFNKECNSFNLFVDYWMPIPPLPEKGGE